MTESRAVITYLHTVAGPQRSRRAAGWTLPNTLRRPARDGHSAWPPCPAPSHCHAAQVSPFSSGCGHQGGRSRGTGLRHAECSVRASALQVLCSRDVVHHAHAQAPPSAAKLPELALGHFTSTPLLRDAAGASAPSVLAQRRAQPCCLQLRPMWPKPVKVEHGVGRKGGDGQKSYLIFSQFLLEGKVFNI